MATYSVNQTRVPIVALTATSSDSTTPGNFKGVVSGDNAMYLQYVNADGQLVLSDEINLNKINYANATKYKARSYRVDKITPTNLVAGQSYSFTMLFRQAGSGSQENTYTALIGPITYKTGMTAEDIVTKLAELGNKQTFNRPVPWVKFTVEGTGAAAKLVVTEQPQPWVLGKAQGRLLQYEYIFAPIIVDGLEDPEWATVETTPGNPGVGVGSEMANEEYFYHGQIGDIYRGMGYPYNWETKYLVDASKEYDVIDISFYYSGEGIYVQHSDKAVMIICEKDATHAVANSVIAAINAVKPGLLKTIPSEA